MEVIKTLTEKLNFVGNSEQRFVNEQGSYITKNLKDLNLPQVAVDSRIERRDSSFFKDKKRLPILVCKIFRLLSLLHMVRIYQMMILLFCLLLQQNILQEFRLTRRAIYLPTHSGFEDDIFSYILPSQSVPINAVNLQFDYKSSDTAFES